MTERMTEGKLDIQANKEPVNVDIDQILAESKKKLDLFKEIIPSITHNKRNILKDESLLGLYSKASFMVTRAMSYHKECFGLAQNLNLRPNIPPRAHYLYLLNTVKKGARSGPWYKKNKTDNIEEAIEIVSAYSGISKRKAAQSIKCLTKAQIEKMRESLETGG
jgi:hypothetical protein